MMEGWQWQATKLTMESIYMYREKDFYLQQESNMGPLAQQASPQPTELSPKHKKLGTRYPNVLKYWDT